jgi:hypothetical protein
MPPSEMSTNGLSGLSFSSLRLLLPLFTTLTSSFILVIP